MVLLHPFHNAQVHLHRRKMSNQVPRKKTLSKDCQQKKRGVLSLVFVMIVYVSRRFTVSHARSLSLSLTHVYITLSLVRPCSEQGSFMIATRNRFRQSIFLGNWRIVHTSKTSTIYALLAVSFSLPLSQLFDSTFRCTCTHMHSHTSTCRHKDHHTSQYACTFVDMCI